MAHTAWWSCIRQAKGLLELKNLLMLGVKYYFHITDRLICKSNGSHYLNAYFINGFKMHG